MHLGSYLGDISQVGRVRAELDAMLAEAAAAAIQIQLSSVQVERMLRAGPQSRDREPLIRKLQDQTECVLSIDRGTQMLNVLGSKENVGRVQALLDVHLDVAEHIREAPAGSIPVIIGKGGANIKRLQSESGAQVELDGQSGRVRVCGSKAAVAKAVAALDGLLEQFESQREVRVTQRQIALVIGRGGSTIKQLQADTGATVVVAKDDACVRVRGAKPAVDAAMGRIHAILNPQSAPAGAPATAAPPPGLQPPPPGLQIS